MSGIKMQKITQALSERWKTWRANRTQAADLDCCGSTEIDRIARDLGLPADELKVLAGRDTSSADLLYVRLAALGMDVEKIKSTLPQVMRDMQRCCSDCDEKKRCAHDLESPEGSRMPAYCPNAETLAVLAVTKCRQAKTP